MGRIYNMSTKYQLMGGLGDCLLAGAALQHLGREVEFITSPTLKPLFDYHPTIKYSERYSEVDYEFKWVSQIKDKDLYALHTMQRFSSQIGFYLDPTKVLNIYDEVGQVINDSTEKTICINQFSAEKSRRQIPQFYMDYILDIIPSNYKVIWIGANEKQSCNDIITMVEHLRRCSLFIGPVSFCYHLASCIRTKCLLFTSYMPAHKFSHFFNTTAIEPLNATCRYTCEKDNFSCTQWCQSLIYGMNDIEYNLRKILQ